MMRESFRKAIRGSNMETMQWLIRLIYRCIIIQYIQYVLQSFRMHGRSALETFYLLDFHTFKTLNQSLAEQLINRACSLGLAYFLDLCTASLQLALPDHVDIPQD